MSKFVVISGCSGGGKSTLLIELARRGHAVVDEPGRRIVQEELLAGGAAIPWVDMAAFSRRAFAMASADLKTVRSEDGWVFFDRGLVDAATALEHATGEPAVSALCRGDLYHRRVFLAPPWPEIYVNDPQRRHGFGEAVAEYNRLLSAYSSLGYELTILPKLGVSDRADFVLDALSSDAS